MSERPQGGPFWGGVQPPLQGLVAEGDLWWDGTTLWIQRAGAWAALSGQAALPAGTVVQLHGDWNGASQPVTSALTAMKSFALPANTYSLIRIRAVGIVAVSAASAQQVLAMAAYIGGVAFGIAANTIQVEIAPTSARIPFVYEMAALQQSPATIAFSESAPAGDGNTLISLISFVVEGIV